MSSRCSVCRLMCIAAIAGAYGCNPPAEDAAQSAVMYVEVTRAADSVKLFSACNFSNLGGPDSSEWVRVRAAKGDQIGATFRYEFVNKRAEGQLGTGAGYWCSKEDDFSREPQPFGAGSWGRVDCLTLEGAATLVAIEDFPQGRSTISGYTLAMSVLGTGVVTKVNGKGCPSEGFRAPILTIEATQ